MSLKATHPQYDKHSEQWTICADVNGGELAIKAKGSEHLPPTSGHIADGFYTNGIGRKAYDAYRTRAVFPDFYAEAVEKAIGTMHRKPPIIELPPAMEPLRNNCTLNGDSMESLLRSINVNQIARGRVGLLGDLNDNDRTNPLPYLSLYSAASIRNWSDRRDLIVLDESREEMTASLEWNHKEQYRVLALGGFDENGFTRDGLNTYHTAIGEHDDTLNTADWITPNHTGRQLEVLPFQFINTVDLDPNPDDPPLLGLALICLAIYRGEADYRHTLFMQGQDTLVITGAQDGVPDNEDPDGDGIAQDEIRIGAAARIDLPQGGTAEYIGIGSEGLAEQRAALENDKNAASARAGIPNTTSNQKESGEAIRRRQQAQSISLTQIAKTGAEGLRRTLQSMAPWFNADPEQIIIEPNLDFADDPIEAQNLVDIMTAIGLGAPISRQSAHKWAAEQGYTSLSFDEEMAQIEAEGGTTSEL